MNLVLMVAVGGQQLAEALRIAEKQNHVVFGTMDEPNLLQLDEARRQEGDPGVSVFLYESG